MHSRCILTRIRIKGHPMGTFGYRASDGQFNRSTIRHRRHERSPIAYHLRAHRTKLPKFIRNSAATLLDMSSNEECHPIFHCFLFILSPCISKTVELVVYSFHEIKMN